MSYQGWANQETWCVWCTLNNTKEVLDQALEAVKAPRAEQALGHLCQQMHKEIVAFAPWVWDEFGGYYMFAVHWSELVTNFKAKLKEMV